MVGLGLCLGISGVSSVSVAYDVTVQTLRLDDTDGNPNTTLGIQSHQCPLGTDGDIFDANPATNLLTAYTYNGSAFTTVGNTFDVTSLLATDPEIDSVEISDSVYRVNATSVGLVNHAVDKHSLYSWDGTDFSYVGVHNLTDTSGNCMVSYLADNEIVVYTGNSAVPEEIVKYTVNPSTGALTKVGNSYTSGLTGTSTHVYGLSSTRVAVVEFTNSTTASLFTLDHDGTDWTQTGNSLALTVGMTNSYKGYKWDDNTVILWQNGTVEAYSFDGTDWTQEGTGIDTGYGAASSTTNPRHVIPLSSSLLATKVRWAGNGEIKAVENAAPYAPINTAIPTIDNTTPSQGDTLTLTNGTWDELPAGTSAYQWQRTGVDISGATSSTYTTVADDVGETITCEETRTNSEGSTMAETAATSAVQAAASYMQGVESTCDMDCDATISDSADGTTANWLNLIASPSEGSQADYDLLGTNGIVSGDFTGTAGTSGAYWDKNVAAEYFAIRDMGSTSLRFMPHTGTSGGSWWVALVFDHGTSSAQAPWGNAYVAADTGVYFLTDQNGWRRVYLADGSTTTAVSNSNGTQDYAQNTDVFWCITADMSASTNNVRFTMGTTHLLLPWAVGGSNRSTDATLDFFVGAANSTSSPPRAGISLSHLKAISFGYASDDSAFLSEAKINAIRSEYDTRHSTTY